MEAKPSETASPDLDPALHSPLLTRSAAAPGSGSRQPLRPFLLLGASIISLLSLVALINIINQNQQEPLEAVEVAPLPTEQTTSFCNTSSLPRGVAQGVSPKSNPSLPNKVSYNWTNAMFSWQRTAYHFQPQKNWMNDPNGPLYHLGWYHLFYQYNPESAVWGNITWGHAVSRDLIHWLHLPTAMIPDTWFDINGVWTGSATLLPDGKIVMLYTGSTNQSMQVQNLAYPADLSDPLLLHWVKYADNPVLMPPPDIDDKDFRDPTTAWVGPDRKWRVVIGSKVGRTGISLVYTTQDFIHFDLNDHYLHEVSGTGMWECVDFYPISVNGSKELDTSVGGPGIKHVLKVSLDDTKEDHYAIGTYSMENDTWAPDNPNEDVGRGLRLDYGRFYASKSFYDQIKERRILWGWINETDAEYADLKKGWASIQSIPRTVVFDKKTGKNVVQWPVEEVESLRLNSTEFQEILVTPGSVVPLDIGVATQLDIYGEFEIEMVKEKGMDEKDEKVEGCGGGAMHRSTLGPFGILAIADDTLSELTPIYFRLSNTNHPNANTSFCVDQTRSSEATDVLKVVDGGKVRVLSDEKLSMRVLIDHSIIESFGQGGRTVITSRVYPTKAIYGAAKLFVFNNATAINVKASLKIWQLNSAFIRPFPFDE